MSAEVLRRAAALMRERASLARNNNPWMVDPDVPNVVLDPDKPNDGWDGLMVCEVPLADDGLVDFPTVEHIASWHPAVALAVADWLDTQAARWEQVYTDTQHPSAGIDQPPAVHFGDPAGASATADHHTRHGIAVARAYLGEAS